MEARILDWTVKRKPADGSTHWSTRKLGLALTISHMMVARVISFDGAHEIAEFRDNLDTGKSASSDHECQKLSSQIRVDIRFLEDVDHVVAQRHGIRKCPKRQRVLYDARHAVEVRDIAERNDEVVVFEFELTRTEPRTDRYHPSI